MPHAPPLGLARFPPPMVADVHPQAVQLTVKWVDNGRPQDLGNIDIRATSHDLVRKWNRPGTFQLMPVDMEGLPLDQRPHVVEIDPGHEAFRVVATPATSSPGMPYTTGMDPTAINAIIRTAQEPMSAQVAMLATQLAEAQRVAAEAQRAAASTVETASKERLALAMRESGAVSSQYEKLHERESARTAENQSQMLAMFQATATQQAQQFQQHMAQQQASADAERERQRVQHERDLERERDRRKEEETARNERAKAEVELRRRDEEDRERRWEQERTRDREYHERTLALIKTQNAASDPQAMLQKTIDMVAGAAGKVGIDLSKIDLMGMMVKLVTGGGPTSIPELFAQTVKAVVDGVVELKKIEADNADDGDDAIEVPVQDPQTGQVTVQIVPRDQYNAMVAQAKQVGAQQPAGAIAQGTTPATQPAPAQPTPAQAAQSAAVQALDPATLKTARGALRNLVAALKAEKDKAKWPDMIKAAVAKDLQPILAFVQAATIRGAVKEAGADDGLASAIVGILADSGVVPTSVLG
jgi:hypothetical protein